VLVNWAWESDALTAVRGNLGGTDLRAVAKPAAAAGAPAAAAEPAARDGGGTGTAPRPGAGVGALWGLFGLGWLLLAGMIAAILWLLVPACGLRPAFLPSFCPAPEAEVPAALAETRVLEDEIARLLLTLADADRACQPPPPPPPPPPPAAPAPTALPPVPVPQQSEIDRRLNAAGAQRGLLQFSLAWNSRSDLDLHVTCPNGRTINYRSRANCGGRLDVDMNAGAGRSSSPVENVYFDAPGAGRYRLRVNLFGSANRGAPEPFELQIRDGDRVQVLRGTVRPGSPDWTADHNHGGN
jgi:hypothetical protein